MPLPPPPPPPFQLPLLPTLTPKHYIITLTLEQGIVGAVQVHGLYMMVIQERAKVAG